MPKKPEDFSLENLGELSKEKIAKQQEKEAHTEWVEGFKKRKKAEEEERAEDLESLGARDKKAAAKGRSFRQELKFEKTISGKIKEIEEDERRRDLKQMAEKAAKGHDKPFKKEKKQDDKFDFSDADAEKKQEQKKLRKKPAPEKEAEQDLAELRASMQDEEPEEKISDKKSARDGELYRHLRANLSDYPQFITPEIKINLKTVEKQRGALLKYQDVIDKNTGNVKKKAQDKIKEARQKIKEAKDAQKRAQDVIDGHIRDVMKHYNTSCALLAQLSEDLNGDGKKQGLVDKINEMYEKGMGKGKPYKIEKRGALNGLKKFFQDKKLKKKLGEDGWEKFEQLKLDYLVKADAYKNRFSVHAKKYGKLDEIFKN